MAGVEEVGSPVTESSHSEIVPAAPVALIELPAVVMIGGLHQPHVPVDGLRHRIGIRELPDAGIEAVPASRSVHVDIDLVDILDDSGIHPGLELEIILSRMALVAHLGDNLRMSLGCIDE